MVTLVSLKNSPVAALSKPDVEVKDASTDSGSILTGRDGAPL